jgi:predicted HTH domain antitoxin
VIGKDVATKNLAELKAELMREQIRLARSKNEREAGDVIDREVVEAMLVTLGQKLNLLLRLKLEVELGPRGVGMNAAELNVEGGVILGEIREVINANIATFEGEALDRSRGADAIV